jgi:hypothetical protein
MKTRILILLIAISFKGNAQGDLQFNQVLTFTGTTGSTIIYTVPEGKVAKMVLVIVMILGLLTTELNYNMRSIMRELFILLMVHG